MVVTRILWLSVDIFLGRRAFGGDLVGFIMCCRVCETVRDPMYTSTEREIRVVKGGVYVGKFMDGGGEW
jgi:hypothetical protein